MQVKEATFQKMGNGVTANRWNVSGGQSAPPAVYLIFPR